jgi:hypothetical protein
LAERLLGLDIGPTNSYLDVAIPDRNPVMVHVTSPPNRGACSRHCGPTE